MQQRHLIVKTILYNSTLSWRIEEKQTGVDVRAKLYIQQNKTTTTTTTTTTATTNKCVDVKAVVEAVTRRQCTAMFRTAYLRRYVIIRQVTH